jgi:hypothetical protein
MNRVTKKVCAAILSTAFFIFAIFSFSACQGDNGENGADGLTPFIGENGHWWIGETDTGVMASGQNGRDGLNGENGADGQNGTPGKDAISPMFIYDAEGGNLKISYDNGESWSVLVNIGALVSDGVDGVSITSCEINDLGELVVSYSDGRSENLGVVVATNGVDGAPGKNGEDGKNGVDGIGIDDATINEDGHLVITLTDGQVLDLGNVQGQDGTDGINGVDGAPGKNGEDGKNGVDAITPKIRINADNDMWEISYDNGESWESLGHPSTGEAGANGVTPIIGIDDDGYWKVSYDLGKTWRSLEVKAVGEDGEKGSDGRGIEKVEIIGGYLYVTYTDGETFNAGKVMTEAGGSIATDVYTDALEFYPNADGTSYSVSIGNAIYMEHIVIPSSYNGKPVTAILPQSFGCNGDLNEYLKSIVIPDSVTVIGAEAFALCISLESVHIPESVTVIGICAFNEKTVVYFDRAEDASLGWNSGYIGALEIHWKE